MATNPWLQFIQRNRGSGKTLKALSKQYRAENPNCCKPAPKKGKRGRRPQSPTPRRPPPSTSMDELAMMMQGMTVPRYSRPTTPTPRPPAAPPPAPRAPIPEPMITKEELARRKKNRRAMARADAEKRREAFKKQKEGMSRSELLAENKAQLKELKARKKRAEENMLAALRKQGVADPKKDPRWKEFSKRLKADFDESEANLEKKYRPTRKTASFDIAALNSEFEDDDDDDDDEDFVPRYKSTD